MEQSNTDNMNSDGSVLQRV